MDIAYTEISESLKQKITRITGNLEFMNFKNFEILPGTENAFTAARKFADLDHEMKFIYREGYDPSDDEIEANTIDKNFLTFVGPPGCGKTHLGVSAIRSICENCGWHYEYWQVADLLRTLREKTEKQNDKQRNYESDGTWLESLRNHIEIDNSYNGIIKRLCGETPVTDFHYLLFDDLGVEKYSDWALEILQLIIDKRYINDDLYTIFTTNDFAWRRRDFPPRIRSRLLSGVVVPVTAGDYRLRIGKLSYLKAIHRSNKGSVVPK